MVPPKQVLEESDVQIVHQHPGRIVFRRIRLPNLYGSQSVNNYWSPIQVATYSKGVKSRFVMAKFLSYWHFCPHCPFEFDDLATQVIRLPEEQVAPAENPFIFGLV